MRRGGTGRRGTARRRIRGTRSGLGRTGVGELKRRCDGGWVGYARLERRGVPRERHLGDPLGTRRQCGTRRPKSVIHDRPSERLAAGRSVASRRARLRTRWTLRPTADGAGCSARVRSSSLTIAARTRGRQSRLNQKAHRENPTDRATTWTDSSHPPSDVVVLVLSVAAKDVIEAAFRLFATVRLAGSAHHRRGHHGDRSRARQVRRHRRRPGRHHRRCVVMLSPGSVLAFQRHHSLGANVSASTSPPRASPSPPLPPSSSPLSLLSPSQALWTRCPSPARTSRWTR